MSDPLERIFLTHAVVVSLTAISFIAYYFSIRTDVSIHPLVKYSFLIYSTYHIRVLCYLSSCVYCISTEI